MTLDACLLATALWLSPAVAVILLAIAYNLRGQ